MEKPNWKDSFKNLPLIPKLKQWKDDSEMTDEQKISLKFLKGEPISPDEEKTFSELSSFYEELAKKLKKLDYSSFTSDELEEFKNYLFYALNYRIFAPQGITIFSTYRLVINEKVSEKNERIFNSKYLSYPTLEIVKNINRYNRASTPNTTLFYTCQNIDTALNEIRPPKEKLITVGVWVPKERKKFLGYAISNSEVAAKFNLGIAQVTKAFEETKEFNHELFFNFAKNYLDLIGYEFTKKVSHHYEYIISALFAESTLMLGSGDNKFECIIYPSVGNGYKTDNVGFITDIIDKEFVLEKAIEFEIEEQYFDKEYDETHPELITLAKVKNIQVSRSVSDDGEIKWD